jgi:hypothetical protein
MPYLTAMGIRTAVDLALVESLGADVGGFDQKLREMKSRGIIDEAERSMLSVVADAGSAAAHRGFVPNESELGTMLAILESVLYQLFVRPEEIKELRDGLTALAQRVPPRPPRP